MSYFGLQGVAANFNSRLRGQPAATADREPFIFDSARRAMARGDFTAPGPDGTFVPVTLNDVPETERNPIALALNPSEVAWQQGKRISKQDYRAGSVFWHFTDDRGANNDILTLQCRARTGSIRNNYVAQKFASSTTPETSSAAEQEKLLAQAQLATERLVAFHEMLLLSREPMHLSNGYRNEMVMRWMSPLFPLPLKCYGHFDPPVNPTETGDGPFSSTYTFGFVVTRTVPRLEDYFAAVSWQGNLLTPIPNRRDIEGAFGVSASSESDASGGG